jgi:hypothetical protein
MKMMRYFSALMLTVALAACNREALPDKDTTPLSAGKGMTFKASLAPVESRSSFGANADESGVLYWEESDRVLICAALQTDGSLTEWWKHFSEKIDEHCTTLANGQTDGSYIGKDVTKYIHTTIAVPEINATDRTQALLHTDITPSSLLPERDLYNDALYEMLAIYPVSENRTMKLIAMYDSDGNAAVGFPVEVPHIQNGKDFGRYHVCMDTGFDEEDPNGILGLYHASDIINGNVVNFHRFKPVTSLLRFNIRTDNPDPVEIAKLVIDMKGVKGEGDQFETKLTGSSWVSTWGDDPWIIPDRWEEETYNDVEIVFDTPILVSSTPTTEKYCAVVLPSFKNKSAPHYANTYGADAVEFRAYSADGTLLFRTTKAAPAGNAGDEPGFRTGGRYDFTLELQTETPPEGALSGQFSLAEGMKAYIATGNLWAYVSNGVRDNSIANNGWKLAAHQYDIVGSAADWTNFNSYSGWIDLFGFSTTSNDHGISISEQDSDYSGDPAGWTDCMAASGWRTITADEGVYLFTERTNAMNLFAYATVYVGSENNLVKGLVFLPDNWATPAGCSFTPVSQIGFNFGVNTYNAEGATTGSSGNWEDMEALGAVFWPVAGKRVGNNVDYGVGSYWSGSPDDNWGPEYADILLFDTTRFDPVHDYRYIGGCVRLVRDVSE